MKHEEITKVIIGCSFEVINIDVGLLINFGNPKLEYKRFTRTREKRSLNMDGQDQQDEEKS